MEEAVKVFLTVSLTEFQTKSLLHSLKLTDSLSGKVQNNLGKIVLFWMGGVSQWEMRELVEGLVVTEGLGRHTSALCIEIGNSLANL